MTESANEPPQNLLGVLAKASQLEKKITGDRKHIKKHARKHFKGLSQGQAICPAQSMTLHIRENTYKETF